MSIVGTYLEIPLSCLLLDRENPRLDDLLFDDEEGLIVHLERGYNIIQVADSIATTGYFSSEPLIVLPTSDGKYIALEGNRRLAALKSLADVHVRGIYSRMGSSVKWDELAQTAGIDLDFKVPCNIVNSREESVPIIGFRHITGILDWAPYAQGRYVDSLLKSGFDFATVSKKTGLTVKKVKEMYHSVQLLNQLKETGYDVERIKDSYSLLSVAVSKPALREFAGMKDVTSMNVGDYPVSANKVAEATELMDWIYGTSVVPPVITDSRDMGKLADVVKNLDGCQRLRDGQTIADIHQSLFTYNGPTSDEKITLWVDNLERASQTFVQTDVTEDTKLYLKPKIETLCARLLNFVR